MCLIVFLNLQGLQRFQSGLVGGMGITCQTLPNTADQVSICRGKYVDRMYLPTATLAHAKMLAPTYTRITPDIHGDLEFGEDSELKM